MSLGSRQLGSFQLAGGTPPVIVKGPVLIVSTDALIEPVETDALIEPVETDALIASVESDAVIEPLFTDVLMDL
jgi:hypothetical protein